MGDGTRFLHPVELLEHPFQVTGRDSRPGIEELNPDPAPVGIGPELYLPAFVVVFDGVVNEVDQNPPDFFPVRVDGKGLRYYDCKADVCRLDDFGKFFEH
ncbi:hypothetical protein BMS3Abin13_01755 [bacterium BMS3Abin13]|nr:hypothetical protein BMS3Abin13_01755 [bacterium BMS3Abin13]